ncbi:WD40-repeat-containing domain protein [Chytridium lagenaria]|nr:WD40-repeat-containing domain protein [Chytridium lagenaria]
MPMRSYCISCRVGAFARKIDLMTGKSLAVYKGHAGPVSCIQLSYGSVSDGEQEVFLYTGSWDKTIRKWNAKTREVLMTFTGHADFVKSIFIHGNIVISGSSDSTMRSWNATTGKTLHICKGVHRRPVEAIVLDPESGSILSGSSDTTIRKWTLTKDGEDKASLSGGEVFAEHLTSVYELVVVDEDLWSASADKTAKRWNLLTGKCDMTLEHPDFVKCVTIFGPYVITGGRDENIRVWDAASGDLINTIEAHFGEISSMQVARSKLWTASLDGTIRKWDLKDIATYHYVPPADENGFVESNLSTADVSALKSDGQPKLGMMTAEEEAELAELMDD